jgi:CTP:molybdopterin cytidylyltransferase MocA
LRSHTKGAEKGGLRTTGIILAAGEAKRFGGPKLLAQVRGRPLILRVVEAAVQSCLEEVILVLGAWRKEIEAVVLPHRPSKLKILFNSEYFRGIASSLVAGVRGSSPGTEAFLFLLGDMPFVTSGAIDRLVCAFGASGLEAGCYWKGGRPVHPVIFLRSMKENLLGLKGDQGARELLRELSTKGQLLMLPMDESPDPMDLDIDTPEDLV